MSESQVKSYNIGRWIVGAGVLVVAGLVMFMVANRSSASAVITITKNNSTYTATSSETVRRWRYVITEATDCNNNTFSTSNDSQAQNPLLDSWDSNAFTPTAEEIEKFDQKYICFAALIQSTNKWIKQNRQLDFSSTTSDGDEAISQASTASESQQTMWTAERLLQAYAAGRRNFSGLDIEPGVNLSGANLAGIDLSDTDLLFSDFSYADLSQANLSGAILSNANLRGANLSDTDLTGADLTGADLTGTDLWGDIYTIQ